MYLCRIVFFLLGEASNVPSLQFCQAARQLASVPSSKLRVKLAAGGDPTFAFNVRYTGEEVHGTSWRKRQREKMCALVFLVLRRIVSAFLESSCQRTSKLLVAYSH